jgi:hypothetical protein
MALSFACNIGCIARPSAGCIFGGGA